MRRPVAIAVVCACIAAAIGVSLALTHPWPSRRVSTALHPITVTDALSRVVVLPHPAERIVVADDNQAEQVMALGAAERVVGIEGSIPRRGFFDDMASKPVVGNQWRGLNYELIAKLRPDLVILVDAGPTAPIIAKLRQMHIPVFVTSIYPQKIPRAMLELGKALGEEKRAREFVSWWMSELRKLKELASHINATRPLKVFVSMNFAPSPLGMSLFTCGKRAAWNYWFRILHLENIAAKYMEGCGRVSLEWLARQDPDVIIVGDWSAIYTGYTKNSTEPLQKIIERICSNPLLRHTSACIHHRVFIVGYQLLLNIRSIVGAFYLGKALYPKAFSGVDPDELHAWFFEHWYHEPYRGIWFYPEPWRGGG